MAPQHLLSLRRAGWIFGRRRKQSWWHWIKQRFQLVKQQQPVLLGQQFQLCLAELSVLLGQQLNFSEFFLDWEASMR